MRFISAAAAIFLLALPALGVPAAQAGSESAQNATPACKAWDRGADARKHGWSLTKLAGADRWAIIAYYDKRVGPRADPKSDTVLVASHPDWPLVRVVIVHSGCIVDIGQMGPDLLTEILRNAGEPA